MTNSDRLSRIESIIESNAKSIEALSNDLREMRDDRNVLYNLVSDLTGNMAALTVKQLTSYEVMRNLDDRQQQLANQQQQLINIMKSMED